MPRFLLLVVLAPALAIAISPLLPTEALAQVITGKRCTGCGKSVPITSQVGQSCPHCGAVWTFKTTRYSSDGGPSMTPPALPFSTPSTPGSTPPVENTDPGNIIDRIYLQPNMRNLIRKDEPTLQIYSVASGKAETLVKTLEAAFKDLKILRISNVGNGKILVYALPSDQARIAKHLQGAEKEPATRTEFIAIGSLNAAQATRMLAGMFGQGKSTLPDISCDPGISRIVVRGTAEQIKEVQSAVRSLEGAEANGHDRLRAFDLGKLNGSDLAEKLARLLGEMRQNPVHLVHRKPEKNTELPREEDDQDRRPGSKDKPIYLYASDHRLAATSQDVQALALVRQLVDLHVQSLGAGNFEILRLKTCSAVDAARALDEAFNGPVPGSDGGAKEFFTRFGTPGVRVPGTVRENRIRVVAYPPTRSILLRATPGDRFIIRRLLSRVLFEEINSSRLESVSNESH